MAGALSPVLGGELPGPRCVARGDEEHAEKTPPHGARIHQTVEETMMNAMKDSGTLQVSTPSEREIAMRRVFDAPRTLVWDALTKPELIKRWLGVRGGWRLDVCEVDLKEIGRASCRERG